MQNLNDLKQTDWLYAYKKKIIVGIITVLTLSIAITMIFIAVTLRNRLIEDSKISARDISEVIESSLGQFMTTRDPGRIQSTLVAIGKNESSIKKAFILDKNGRVAYSSQESEIGAVMDKFNDESCRGCHRDGAAPAHETTMIMYAGQAQILRSVNVIYNEKPCHRCHSPSDRINGKLIIDRSIEPTYSLIGTIELMIIVLGALCLVFLVPFLSRMLSKGVDKYINEILLKSTELTLLYGIVERLSKSIEMDELKQIVVDIIRDALGADEIHMILPKDAREYSGITWNRIENKITRRKAKSDDPLNVIIAKWLKGEIAEEKISEDKKELYMPVRKGDSRFALIAARKAEGAFESSRLGLVRAMGSHIAVAFENAALYHIAITDELTGLYSKRHFWASIEKKFLLFENYGEKLSLLMIDIDDFKKINDTYGHPAGDSILKDIGQCILTSTRDGDLDFRYGGEEFAVILPATDETGGRFVAERIRQKIEGFTFKIGDTGLRLTVSVGVATCPRNAQTIKDFIVEADKALYEAKKAGKNRVVLSAATV